MHHTGTCSCSLIPGRIDLPGTVRTGTLLPSLWAQVVATATRLQIVLGYLLASRVSLSCPVQSIAESVC